MNALLAIAITIASTLPSVGQERPKIAVVPTETSRVSADLSTYVQTLLEDELGRSGRFVLVERGQVAKVLEELSFQQSGVTTTSDMTEIGHHLNVEKLFFLGIHRLYPNYKASVKIVDVATNKIIRIEEQDLGTKVDQVKIPTLKLAQRLIQSALLLEPVQMVFFPAGEFLMGSVDGTPDEQPQHPVSLSPFYLDRYEVSEIAFRAFREASGQPIEPIAHPDHPAVMVSWTDADQFCGWQDKRLPTEAEWEFAAKGSAGRPYPWGDAPATRSLARYGGLYKGPVPVHGLAKGATPEGLLHMAGNVAEWVQDWWQHGYFATSPKQDPMGPDIGDYKIVRGGSWSDSAVEIGTSVRGFHSMTSGAHYIGFRCAKSAANADSQP